MTVRVRKALARGEALTFGDLYAKVLREGPATKFAVKSALGKDRERGEITFRNGKYELKTQKSPAPRQGNRARVETPTTTS